MKNVLLISSAVLSAGLAFQGFTHTACAQDATAVVQSTPAVMISTNSTKATGTISEIAANMLFVKSDGATQPLGFILTKDTSYADDQDAPIQLATVKMGRAVIITYVVQGNDRVATKVVVRNAP